MTSESKEKLLIRADANDRIGSGHVMRCLALAQAWRERGGHAAFLAAHYVSALEDRVRAEGFDVRLLQAQAGSPEDAGEVVEAASSAGNGWVVVDGYGFGAEYQRIIRDAGCRLLVVDDYGHAGHYHADLVLNQNIYATPDSYPNREPYTRLLMGTRYVLLRHEFLEWRSWQRKISEQARRVLITLGGSDPDNVTLKMISAIKGIDVPHLEALIIAGPANRYSRELRAACQSSGKDVRIESNVPNMTKMLAWADVAITAGGSTCYECAYMGLPNIIIQTAENQAGICRGMDAAGCSVFAGTAPQVTATQLGEELSRLAQNPGKRASMSQQGKSLVEGGGSRAAVEAMTADNGQDGRDTIPIRIPSKPPCRVLSGNRMEKGTQS